MKACKHSHVLPVMFHQVIDGRTHACRADFCEDCSARLPLGPANDTPEALLELRAAEIAAERSWPNTCCSVDDDADCEECGWHEYLVNYCPPDARDGYHAGHLAACIATHGEE